MSSISLLFNNISAQNVKLDASTNTHTFNQCSGYFYDDGGSTSNYGLNYDYWITLCSQNTLTTSLPQRLSLYFEEFNLDNSDTLWLYEGRSISGTPIAFDFDDAFTGTSILGKTASTLMTDTTGCITARFKSNTSNVSSGWKAKIECISRCQFPVASLDTFFIKYDKAGNMSTRPIRDGVDSIWNASHDSLTVTKFKSVDFCIGDSIILIAKPEFPENNAVYNQTMASCQYKWDFGDGDTLRVNYNERVGHKWEKINGYDLNLTVFDTLNGGCTSRNTIDTRVRIAKNPIKTVSPLPDMCSGQLFLLNVGYSGNNSVNIDSIKFIKEAKERYVNTVFIPDGPFCASGTQCYLAPVTFNQFRPSSTIISAQDVKSICINMEHSYLGDLDISIVCPSGQSVSLKNYSNGGTNKYLGVPAGGDGHDSFDFTTPCAAPPNIEGIGFTYCFSTSYPTIGSLGGSSPTSSIPFNVPAWAANPTGTVNSVDSTNISNSSGYFSPSQTFAGLVGCPLNGEWNIQICDHLGSDNGFVFWWELELSQNSSANWDYQVPLDTVIWDGPFMQNQTATSSEIVPPISANGTFRYDIHIIDDFGCVWDTATSLKVVQTPIVNLGPDTAICEQFNVVLDAGNPGATKYMWEPTGETTQTILARTLPNSNSLITYVAQVTNFNGSIYCYGSDSINLIVRPAALASLVMDKNPLEGCEPYSFQLFSASTNADTIEWTVGPLTSRLPNPSFTFPYGNYDLRLKVSSEYGCKDSIFLPGIINVYKSPIADFGWNPTNPAVSNPTINFINLTTPIDNSNQYHWKIQANKINNLRDNVFGFEPTYTWVPVPGSNVVGDYNVTLDAYSVNPAPSGNVYECHDTISKVITIINDNLIFPNVITPNGDGINDVFIIKNLVEGQAYPDNEISIYNRNGKRVFFKQDIRSNEEIWDPAKTNTPTGTYFFKFIGRGPIRDVEFNGSIEIIR